MKVMQKFADLTTLGCIFLFFLSLIFLGCKDDDSGVSDDWIPNNDLDWGQSVDFGRKPLWSPNGEYIIFGDDTPGMPGIFLWRKQNNPVRIVNDSLPHNWDYCWSSDSRNIVFTNPGAVDDPKSGIWIYNLESSELKNVFQSGRDVCWYVNDEEFLVRLDLHQNDSPGIYRIYAPDTLGQFWQSELLIPNGHKPRFTSISGNISYIDNERNGSLVILNQQMEVIFHSLRGVISWISSNSGNWVGFTRSDYISGNLQEVLYEVRLNENSEADTLLRWVSNPTADSSGTKIVFNRLTGGIWSGLWLYNNPNDVKRIADYGFNSDFHPFEDKIVANSTNGGIRVLTRVR